MQSKSISLDSLERVAEPSFACPCELVQFMPSKTDRRDRLKPIVNEIGCKNCVCKRLREMGMRWDLVPSPPLEARDSAERRRSKENEEEEGETTTTGDEAVGSLRKERRKSRNEEVVEGRLDGEERFVGSLKTKLDDEDEGRRKRAEEARAGKIDILVDEDGYIKIIDYGLAKMLGEEQESTSFCGTPEYLAPEMIN